MRLSEDPDPSDFTIHFPPYHDMPLLTSHLHPRFVILEAGRKLSQETGTDAVETLVARYPILRKIIEVYKAWTAERPADAMDDGTYDHGTDALHIDSDHEEDSAKHTTRRRLVVARKYADPDRPPKYAARVEVAVG